MGQEGCGGMKHLLLGPKAMPFNVRVNIRTLTFLFGGLYSVTKCGQWGEYTYEHYTAFTAKGR